MNKQSQLFDTEPPPWEFDAAELSLIASVVLPQGPDRPFDYLVPEHLREEVEPGRRVKVPFGRGNRPVVGYCVAVETKSHGPRKLKELKAVVDTRALLTPSMLRLTKWMAEHYLCSWGAALEAVLPAAVRSKAGTREVTFLSVPTAVAARLTQLKLPPKQAQALKALAGSTQPLTVPQLASRANCTTGPINELRKKKLVHVTVKRVQQMEVDEPEVAIESHMTLNADQQAALDTVLEAVRGNRYETLLMHGVTGSGKTEVYIQAIDEVLSYGRQAIVLVPEISLTPQTRRRFQSRFPHVAVLHSHLTPAERNWHWQRIARGEVQVVVGARSAVFAPVKQLGLIVVDEEHDSSFKQGESPRYHAREVAVERARMEGVPLVLGSATPSLESWQQARAGNYKLISMPRRVLDLPLPVVGTIDLRNEYKSRFSRGAISRPLHQAIAQALKDDGQVILLLNRRGFATHIQCPACGFVVKCPNCDLALTHHRQGERAVCHYCDYEIEAPPVCPECKFAGIRYGGLGTQKLEAEVKARFADYTCLRMDSDTMTAPGSHEEALEKFRRGEVKILLGTQMIAKGLDFPNVTLVGVINADTALHLPDFRAGERTFQLVTQVAGRTGRGTLGGRVLVQTFSPEHAAIQAAVRHDYATFADQELPIREEYGYPPFTSMVRIELRSESESQVEAFAEQLGEAIRKQLDLAGPEAGRVRGPAPAPIAKLRGNFRFHMLVQGPELDPLRAAVAAAGEELKTPEGVIWVPDVDPLDMM